MRPYFKLILSLIIVLAAISLFPLQAATQDLTIPLTYVNLTSMNENSNHSQNDLSFSSSKHPSPLKALMLSVGTTLIPVMTGVISYPTLRGRDKINHWEYNHDRNYNRTIPDILIATGLIIGPSTGFFYGRCESHAVKGILVRGFVLAGSFIIATSIVDSQYDNDFIISSNAVGYIGLGITGIHAICDVVSVHKAVRRENEKMTGTTLSLGPRYFANNDAVGLELKATF